VDGILLVEVLAGSARERQLLELYVKEEAGANASVNYLQDLAKQPQREHCCQRRAAKDELRLPMSRDVLREQAARVQRRVPKNDHIDN